MKTISLQLTDDQFQSLVFVVTQVANDDSDLKLSMAADGICEVLYQADPDLYEDVTHDSK